MGDPTPFRPKISRRSNTMYRAGAGAMGKAIEKVTEQQILSRRTKSADIPGYFCHSPAVEYRTLPEKVSQLREQGYAKNY